MDCCSANGLDEMFSKSGAQRELKAYLKKGLDKRARLLTDFIKGQGLAGSSVLEVGGGIGILHMELLKAGAARAVGYDVSSAYVEAATSLSERLGLRDSVEYHVGDFVEQAPSAEDADIVVLDRVLCCYPNMKALVTASGGRARRLCALTYPRRTWWTRAGVTLANLGLATIRKRFRGFVHDPKEVSATLAAQGLTRIFHATSGLWEVVVYQRREPLAHNS